MARFFSQLYIKVLRENYFSPRRSRKHKQKGFERQLKISNEETIYVFLINKNGRVLWHSHGGFTEEKGLNLERVVKEDLR